MLATSISFPMVALAIGWTSRPETDEQEARNPLTRCETSWFARAHELVRLFALIIISMACKYCFLVHPCFRMNSALEEISSARLVPSSSPRLDESSSVPELVHLSRFGGLGPLKVPPSRRIIHTEFAHHTKPADPWI